MDAELRHKSNYELKMLENARKEYAFRLEHLRDFQGTRLKWAKPGKHTYYYVKRRGSKKYRYIGVSRKQEIEKVREARFLEVAIQRIDRNIELLKSLMDGFLPYDPSSINECLPAIYRCEVPPVSELYKHESEKWKTQRLEFQKGFPENYPQKKRHTTTDGIKVKTISEVTLYEMFKAAGLAQIYELPLPLDDYGPPIYPDFTILSPVDMKTAIFVEYVGRLDRQDYREDFARRLGRYIANGYKPGVNLFFVFSDRDGNIDATQVAKVIADIKGLNTQAA